MKTKTPQNGYRLGYAFVAGIVVAGIALSFLAFDVFQVIGRQKIRAEFERDAENHSAAFRREIESDMQVLVSIKALHAAVGSIKRSEFRDLVTPLLAQHRSIQALEWIPRVPDSLRRAYETAAQKDGFPHFRIAEQLRQGVMIREGERKEYFPVYFVEPYKGNEIALGFDLASNPARREALQSSLETGNMTATARITLVQETAGQFGFIVFIPVYGNRTSGASGYGSRNDFRGFALGVFRIGDILEKSLSYLKEEGIDISLYDTSAPESERFLYFHPSRLRRIASPQAKEKPDTDASMKYAQMLDVGGRKWMILCTPRPGFISARKNYNSWVALAGGLLFTLTVAGHLVSTTKRNEKLSVSNKKLEDEIWEHKKTEEKLYESEKRYHTLFEQSPDGVLLIDIEGKIVEFNETASSQLGYSREEFAKLSLSEIDASSTTGIVETIMEKILEAGQYEFEVRHRTKQGDVRDVSVKSKVIVLSGRKFFHSIWRDITKRKLMERRQALSGEILGILNNPPEADNEVSLIISAIKRESGSDALGIRLQQGDDFPYFAQEGFPDDFMRTENTLAVHSEDGRICKDKDGNIILECACGLVISGRTDTTNPLFTQKGSFWTNELFTLLNLPANEDPRVHPRNRCIHEGFHSEALIPLNSGKQIIGLLQVNDRRPNQFTPEVISFFEDLGSCIGIALARQKAQQEIKQSLREKEMLLREIHHRVKNNMAVVSSLLALQANRIKDPTVRSLLEETQQRVKSMALVHEKLYQTKSLSSVNFEDYIKSIISEITSLFRIDTGAITTEIKIDDIELDLETAVPCGLIINELLTNAFKHAFPDNIYGVLRIDFAKSEDTYTLSIKDNGVGLPEGFDYKETNTLGLQLVRGLTGQLRGSMQISSDGGTEIVIAFKPIRGK